MIAANDNLPLPVDEIVARAKPLYQITGIYFLIKDGRVVYVGQSTDITFRVHRHRALGKKGFDSYAYIECGKDDLDAIESIYIHTMRPEQNGFAGTSQSMFAPLTVRALADLGIEVDA